MNISESTAVLEKLNNLLEAAEAFGTQSEQLMQARGDFDEYLKSVKDTDAEMAKMIKKCNDYIETAEKIIINDMPEQVRQIVEDTEKSVIACKEQCERVTDEYSQMIALFEKQKSVFEKAQTDLTVSLNSGLNLMQQNQSLHFEGIERKITDSQRAIVDSAADAEKKSQDNLNATFQNLEKVLAGVQSVITETVERLHKEKIEIDKADSIAENENITGTKSAILENLVQAERNLKSNSDEGFKNVKEIFSALNDSTVKTINAGSADNANNLSAAKNEVLENLLQAERDLKSNSDGGFKDVKETLSVFNDSTVKIINAGFEDNANNLSAAKNDVLESISDTENHLKLAADGNYNALKEIITSGFDKIESELTAIKDKQANDSIFIKVGAIAGVIAAIAGIVNLFM